MKLISRLATPLTTGMFLVSVISGIALFFRWSPSLFKSMHEWLSFVALVPFALWHIWKNWGALVNYTRGGLLFIVLGLSVVAAIPFAWTASQSGPSAGGNPAFRAVRLMTSAPLSEVAPLLKSSPDSLLNRLQSKGYKAESVNDSLDKVASASGTEAMKLLQELMPQPQQPR